MKKICEGSSLHKPPPPLGKVKIWNPSPHWESEDLDVLADLENFTTASTRTSPPIGESENLDVLADLEKLTIASIRTLPPLVKVKI